jgi:hypothetical protein
MKQVLFILLVFISFQGFSQTVKLKKIRLEVMTKDLGEMTWYEAKEMCKDFGDGWRLPTIKELKKIYKYKDFIGGFNDDSYWSNTETDSDNAWTFLFSNGDADTSNKYATGYYVRPVRDLK